MTPNQAFERTGDPPLKADVMRKEITLLMMGFILLIGCQDIDTSKIAPPYKVIVHEDGKDVKFISIPAKSDLENRITSFLSSDQTGWKRDWITYAPGLMIRGDNFSLLLGDGAVLNYWPEKNKSFQGIKPSSPEIIQLEKDVLLLINKDS